MQPSHQPQPKPIPRKLYSSPSAATMSSKARPAGQFNFVSKPARIRRTDHTDDKYSEVSGSQAQGGQVYGHVSEEGEDGEAVRDSRERTRIGVGVAGLQYLSQKEENRLKNIHHFYRIRIEQQRSKNLERNEIFISLIEQLQKSHNEKILTLQSSLSQIENDKQQIGIAQERMGTIKSTIEDILKQSQQLKESNQRKGKEIMRKRLGNKEKEAACVLVKEELDVMREKLEQFQRLRLKENKRVRELVDMIERVG